jgi:hypothetical protein
VGLNKVVLAAEALCIGDVFNVGFVKVWGFEKVGPVAPSYSVGRLVVQNIRSVSRRHSQDCFYPIRGCDFDCAFFFAEPGVKGLVCENEYSFVKVWGFEKVGPVAPSYSAGVNR